MWKKSNAPPYVWNDITCSSDGKKLAACSGGTFKSIYYSTDYGVKWKNSNAPLTQYNTIVCNSDFTKLCAGSYNEGSIYNSLNSIDWTPINTPTPNDGWNSIYFYNDLIIASCETNFNVYYYNGTWQNVFSGIDQIAANQSFTIFYGVGNNTLYRSYGFNNWEPIVDSPIFKWYDISCSLDGSIIIVGGSFCYISYDYGNNWINTNLTTINEFRVYVSGDGNFFVAAQYPGLIYFSDDGVTWRDSGAPSSFWSRIRGNSDGTKIFAITTTSDDYGIYYYFKPTPHPVSDICFIKDTLVQTDQGKFPIQSLTKQTIHRMPITLTKTIHHDPYLVKIAANAFGDYPTKDTYMSLKHKVYLDKPIQAKHLINDDTVTLVPYNGETLYNVLLDKHTTMSVHGMLVETLDPNCLIALFYKSKLSPKQKDAMILTINKEPEKALSILRKQASR